MILVTLGTQDKPFKRILEAVDREIEKGNIEEKVIAQVGCTKYKSDNMEIVDYLNQDEFNKYLKECSFVITHGGVGTILSAVKMGKIVIATPRLAKYKEHVNDHQLQIIDSFSEQKYILPLKDLTKLDSMLKKAKTFKPKKYVSNTENIIKHLEDYIDNL